MRIQITKIHILQHDPPNLNSPYTIARATVEPRLCEGVWFVTLYIDGNYGGKNGIHIKSGHIEVPTGSGLSVELDQSVNCARRPSSG